ncbi:MAG TPA: ATP-binding protein [Abditibacterium sp.]|jgi:signal transduction histidine kinase
MSPLFQDWLLPWAQLAVSLFNSVLLLWLGLTVLLNAQKRSWGTWLAGCGLLMGGAFFLSHTAALDFSLESLLDESPTWWMVLAVPLLCLPFGWLILMQWSCGFWDDASPRKHRRARFPLLGATAMFLLLGALCLYAAPAAGRTPFAYYEPKNDATYFGVRAILLLYPPFLLLCTAAALYALANPASSGRMMTEEARRRARPWLFASSLVQLMVSLGVAAGTVFLGYVSFNATLYNLYGVFADKLDFLDLVIEICIAIAVMLLGKAVVSFEIFTGKILPRRGFWRQWRAIVALAAFYAGLVSLSLGFEMRPIYPILLTTGLMSAFLAIFSFRAYTDRERAVTNLAPFVASQHLTQGLLSGDAGPLQRALDEPFRALCEDVLNAGRAVLMARGAHSSLAGAPRLYPPSLPFDARWAQIAATTEFPSRDAVALPDSCGMNYLVPLGDPSNPLGALLLGPRRDGGLYTLEEIEVARAAGEHLLDSQAGATLAARLVELQRQKLAQVQVLDRNARRTLHDDILPLLHSALLSLSAKTEAKEAVEALTAAHRGISDLLREAPSSSSPLARRDFWTALQQEIETELSPSFDALSTEISPEARQFTLDLPPFLADTLFFAAREAARNAARYGRGAEVERPLSLRVCALIEAEFQLELSDDGVGIVALGADSQGGSGSGLALHAALLAIAGGSLRFESGDEGGTRVVLTLPLR